MQLSFGLSVQHRSHTRATSSTHRGPEVAGSYPEPIDIVWYFCLIFFFELEAPPVWNSAICTVP